MIKHILTIAIRNIAKYWNYSVINISGLAIGLASFMFIILYISDELSYDKFNENADRIYRVNRFYNANDANEDAATCPFPLGPTLETAYPSMVEKQVRFFNQLRPSWFFDYTNSKNEVVKFNEKNFLLVDSTVFDVFTFPFIEGDPNTALDRINTIVLTESTAKRYFGDEPAIGKMLRLEEFANFEVTGVIKDIPSQSHFRIDMLASLSTFIRFAGGQRQFNPGWIWNPCWTYVLLKDGIKPEMLDQKFPEFYKTYYTGIQNQEVNHYLQALTDIHLKSQHMYEMHPNSDIMYVYILSIIAGIVLILACINFMNLVTASSAGRAKEIGVKKVFGGDRKGIAMQFLGEAVIQSLFAMIIALLLVELFLPALNNFTGKIILTSFLVQPKLLVFIVLLSIVVGLFAGFYPAIFLSSFQPLKVLKGSLKNGSKSVNARRGLVIFQFTISIGLIIGAFVVFAQLNYLRNAKIGFKKDQIITFETVGQLFRNYDSFKQELLSNKDIVSVTGMEDYLGINHNTRAYQIEGLNPGEDYYVPAFMVDWDFIQTFDFQLVAGRAFSRDFPSDTVGAVVINETMVRNMGWTNETAIGKKVKSQDGDERVIGVVKDFNAMSLRNPLNSFIIDMFRRPFVFSRVIAVRINSNNYSDVIKFIESTWNKFAPTRPFVYNILDQQISSQYNDEEKFGKFTVMLSILAIIIASMGLIGLTSFLAEQRTKEIGIRRVLGASAGSIIKLMSNEFIILLVISNLISWPITYFATSSWLNNYSSHINTKWTLYILSGLITLFIALIITGIRAVRTSNMNPAQTLKYE
ncbi:MAG: FtsX-like permease family protein [Tenuifilaceae bacterium]